MTPLKIGILIDDAKLEKYKIEILNELQKSDFCEITKFIKEEKNNSLDKSSKHLIYKLFNKLDANLFGRGTKYLSLESIKDQIKNEENPDVIINLTASQDINDYDAKYGVWSYVYTSNPIGYWEVVNDIPYTEVTLQRSGKGFENGLILDSYKTVTHQKSMLKNKEHTTWQTHMMVIRELKKLAHLGDKYFEDKKTLLNFDHSKKSDTKQFLDFQFDFSDKAYNKPPTNFEMIKVTCKLLKKYTTFSLRKFFPMNRWFILYSKNKNGEVNSNLSEYKRLYPPSKDYFIADPFMVDDGDKSYLFYEELDYGTSKGYLKVAEYNEQKEDFDKPKMILEMDYHLSYPNVFKHKGEYYMVPESFENKTIDLFKAIDFPTKWKKEKTLMSDVSAVDATFYFHNEKWWVFVNIMEKDDMSLNNELSIFYNDDILSDNWTPHAQNPVICDITSARPAGNIIEKNGKLYRPSQDCSGFYGRKIVISEIEVLNENEFKESKVSEINPDFADDLVAVHTLNSSKRFTVLDAMKSKWED